MTTLADTLTRRIGPRLVLAAADVQTPCRVVEMVRRKLGGRLTIELYFAFDDPYSALAVGQLRALASSRGCTLALFPVVHHGIQADPDGELRRRHCVVDAGRLAERAGLTLGRTTMPSAGDVAFLSVWCEAARVAAGAEKMAAFAVAAMKALWLDGDSTAAIDAVAYRGLYRQICGSDPPSQGGQAEAAVRANEKRLVAKGHWETPAARIAGEWFFAHERLEAMGERLDFLGWPRMDR